MTSRARSRPLTKVRAKRSARRKQKISGGACWRWRRQARAAPAAASSPPPPQRRPRLAPAPSAAAKRIQAKRIQARRRRRTYTDNATPKAAEAERRAWEQATLEAAEAERRLAKSVRSQTRGMPPHSQESGLALGLGVAGGACEEARDTVAFVYCPSLLIPSHPRPQAQKQAAAQQQHHRWDRRDGRR